MVLADNGSVHLLEGSDNRHDDNSEPEMMYFDEREADIQVETFEKQIKSPLRRTRLFGRLRERFLSKRKRARKKKVVQETRDAVLAQLERNSSYDERSIWDLESRDEAPQEEASFFEDTFSSVSSQLTTASYPQRHRHRIGEWKKRMGRSIRKLMRKQEEAIQGNDFGLFVLPDDPNFQVSRATALRELTVPSFSTTPTASRDEDIKSTDAHYHLGDEFPLEPFAVWPKEDEKQNLEADASGLTETTTRSSSFLSWPNDPKVSPAASDKSLFVAFEEECAQLVFQSPKTETPNDRDYLPIDLHSVVSEMNSLSDTDEEGGPGSVGRPLGAAFAHPSCPAAILYSMSTDTEYTEPGGPLGIQCNHPHWDTTAERQTKEKELWSRVHEPMLDGEVTDPPSPIDVPTRHTEWGVFPSDSTDSEITMSEVLQGNTYAGCLSALPVNPWGALKKEQDHPYDEVDYATHKERIIKPTASDRLNIKINRFVAGTMGYQERQDASASVATRSASDRPLCSCIKCAAKSIYEDLLTCSRLEEA